VIKHLNKLTKKLQKLLLQALRNPSVWAIHAPATCTNETNNHCQERQKSTQIQCALTRDFSQCKALRFTDGEISTVGVWVTPNDISGLRRPKNVKYGTKVASSMRMMCTLRFLETFAKKTAKNRQKSTIAETKKVEMWKVA